MTGPPNRAIIADSCALGAAFFKELYSGNAQPLLDAIRIGRVRCVMPEVARPEFLNICRKKREGFGGAQPISEEEVSRVLESFADLPIVWDQTPGHAAMQAAWRTYLSHGIGTWDAYYYNLAKEWDAELWTLDGPFLATVGGAGGVTAHDLRIRAFS